MTVRDLLAAIADGRFGALLDLPPTELLAFLILAFIVVALAFGLLGAMGSAAR